MVDDVCNIAWDNRSFEDIANAFRGIFDRQYYTESGPLVRTVESFLQDKLKKKNVICISNASVAWMMLLDCISEDTPVLLPSSASLPIMEALVWTRTPHNCYSILNEQMFSGNRFDKYGSKTIAIRETEIYQQSALWTSLSYVEGLPRYILDTTFVGAWLDSPEYYSKFSGEGIVVFEQMGSGLGLGCCIFSDNDLLADKLRCMRGSGGIRTVVPVKRTVNGRMSEAQAAFILLKLGIL